MKTQLQLRSMPVLLIFAVVFIAGCSSKKLAVVPPVNTAYNLQVNQPFEQLPNYTRIYFQDGNRVKQGNLDRWSTYCRLHVFNKEQQADYLTAVEKGIFGISKVKSYRQSSNYANGWNKYASNTIGFGTISRQFDPPSYYLYRVELKLNSTDQPDVQTLICSKKWATRGNYYPGLAEIRGALGNIVELKMPGS
jgi:hypothetical protein